MLFDARKFKYYAFDTAKHYAFGTAKHYAFDTAKRRVNWRLHQVAFLCLMALSQAGLTPIERRTEVAPKRGRPSKYSTKLTAAVAVAQSKRQAVVVDETGARDAGSTQCMQNSPSEPAAHIPQLSPDENIATELVSSDAVFEP
jgi:hypothetical protein